MLEKIDLSKKVDKKTYRRVMDEAEEKLGLLQRECKDAGIPVILVFEGMGAAGKGVRVMRDQRATLRPTAQASWRAAGALHQAG